MRIKEILKNKGKTAKEVASASGITEAILSNAANGKGNPSLQTLIKIADALEVSVAELFTDEIDSSKIVGFLHYQGDSRTPTTASQIFDILKEWQKKEFHQLCQSHNFGNIRDEYVEDMEIQHLLDLLCAALNIDCPRKQCKNITEQ